METVILIKPKDARHTSAPTTRETHANATQHGPRKRKKNKKYAHDYELNKIKEKHGFAKLCLVVTGERGQPPRPPGSDESNLLI